MTLKLLALTLCLSSFSAIDQTNSAAPVPKSTDCEKIDKLCQAAGYKVGGIDGKTKRLWVDCITPMTQGKSVAGVTAKVTEADQKLCKALIEKNQADAAKNVKK